MGTPRARPFRHPAPHPQQPAARARARRLALVPAAPRRPRIKTRPLERAAGWSGIRATEPASDRSQAKKPCPWHPIHSRCPANLIHCALCQPNRLYATSLPSERRTLSVRRSARRPSGRGRRFDLALDRAQRPAHAPRRAAVEVQGQRGRWLDDQYNKTGAARGRKKLRIKGRHANAELDRQGSRYHPP